ncbi:hypothetical protein NPIL_585131 [Nephila pilipes]|uniref:Uncharacterized protein n=1 Tax=Nephila pilipes TaxID=299642 RepID=A0A8X6UM56_NEPPI|nr:hypothetical protein NPIL_585131 [Nephila pilipes]
MRVKLLKDTDGDTASLEEGVFSDGDSAFLEDVSAVDMASLKEGVFADRNITTANADSTTGWVKRKVPRR